MARFRISGEAIDVAVLREALSSAGAGAIATFEGIVRNHNDGRPVAALTYESYLVLAESEGNRILAQAVARFKVTDAACVHRIGRLALGEVAVWVGASAAHRGAAFDACRWIIDEVKATVPIWKREHYSDGDADWLHPAAGNRHP